MWLFKNRTYAGERLASALSEYAGQPDLLVLALPRGGVPVAREVAVRLGAPLDVLIVRKLGVPGQEELAFGAVASSGAQVLNHDLIEQVRLSETQLAAVKRREEHELERRELLYRGDRPPLEVEGRTVIVVDDGAATGATMRVAIRALKELNAKRVVAAVPVAPEVVLRQLQDEADEAVCLHTPADFGSVGQWYGSFNQTRDEQVIEILADSLFWTGKE